MHVRNGILAISLASAWCGLADASTLPFRGTIQNVTPPGAPGGRCGPPPVLTLTFAPGATTGTSNIGTFTITASHCVTPTPPVTNYSDGRFSWNFGSGDVLEGTYSGTVTLVPGQPIENVQDYVVTGGTGRFEGAGGTFQHVGSFVFGAGGVTTGQSAFSGTLCLEPGPRNLDALDFRSVGDLPPNASVSPSPSIASCLRRLGREEH